jgi:hypothetical protein
MSDFATSWALSRGRFLDEISGLSKEQLNWKIHAGSLSIGEMAIHIAGVEISFGSQLRGYALDETAERIKRAATEGVVNDLPFPFSEAEITPELVSEALQLGRSHWEPLISAADADIRRRELKSALGPIIDGEGAFARLAFHSAYHQGQAYLMKTAPGFPPS